MLKSSLLPEAGLRQTVDVLLEQRVVALGADGLVLGADGLVLGAEAVEHHSVKMS
jgi:hypothetical protein